MHLHYCWNKMSGSWLLAKSSISTWTRFCATKTAEDSLSGDTGKGKGKHSEAEIVGALKQLEAGRAAGM